MSECLFYDTKMTPTDHVTSQDRLPACYLVWVRSPKLRIRISLQIMIVMKPGNSTNVHQRNNGLVG